MTAYSRCFLALVVPYTSIASRAQDEVVTCSDGELCWQSEHTAFLQHQQRLHVGAERKERPLNWSYKFPYTNMLRQWNSRLDVKHTNSSFEPYTSGSRSELRLSRLLSADNPPRTVVNYTSSFVSDAGQLCFEGNGRAVEGLLALMKAGVTGALFNNTHASPRTRCANWGYMSFVQESPCYPEVFIFAQGDTRTALQQYSGLQEHALAHYSNTYSVPLPTVRSMRDCNCHPQSRSMRERLAGSCDTELAGMVGYWKHHDYHNQDEILCDEGPIQYQTFVLAIMKSSGQMPMHMYDQIRPGTCAEHGYTIYVAVVINDLPEIGDVTLSMNDAQIAAMGLSKAPDHCFPENLMAMLTDLGPDDHGINRSQVTEGELFNGAALRMFNERGWDSNILYSTPGCQCLAGSEVFTDDSPLETVHRCSTVGISSPIRDWWYGESVG